jgi:hypothetical protein
MTAIDFVSHAQKWIAAWNSDDLERIVAKSGSTLRLTWIRLEGEVERRWAS